MALRVYNTLARKKEDFTPVQAGKVNMYVCGPTVYKPSHVGHMVGPVIFDTVKRYLTYLGYQVYWVVNITDVDDKLIVRARELGTTVKELADKMTADYLACLRRLNVVGIDSMPKATEHIGEMIEIIQGLIARRSGKQIIVIAVPTHDAKGRLSGVLVGARLVATTRDSSNANNLSFEGLEILDRGNQLVFSGLAKPSNASERHCVKARCPSSA